MPSSASTGRSHASIQAQRRTKHRALGFNLLLIAQWADDGQTEECVAWARSTFDELSPFTQERSYVNYLGADDERVRQAYGANLPRLAELKRRYDPANLFRSTRTSDRAPSRPPFVELGLVPPRTRHEPRLPRGSPASLKQRA